MVICKYFQQGKCRFGQYCKFEHSFGSRTKTFGNEKNIALLVAEEVLQAERGGQWLLSCYGPFKEKKCIPGMEDVSPEEVRWEMYQAQKTGTVDQINVQFQQMCEQMKAKRNALKNPTPAIVQILEEVQSSGSDNNCQANKGNFAFATPQLGLSNTNQTSTVFSQKPFGTTSNLFGGGSTFNSTQASSSIFGRTTTNNASSVFGGKPSFGSSSIFGGAPTAGNSIFGANKTVTTPFGGTQSSTPSFGGLASQGTSIFGSNTTAQSTFGQSAAFGATGAQTTNVFLKPQTAQSSIFGGAATTSVQSGSIFGGAASATPTATSSVFGAAPAATTAGTGMFGQSMTASSAFGGAPVFGGTTGFGTTQSGTTGSVFGGQTAFGASPVVSSSNVFGGSNTTTSSFGAVAQGTTSNVFGGASTVTGANAFEAAPNAAPFGAPISTAAAPFGTMNAGANSVFATAASTTPGPFGNMMTSFSKGASFGFATPATNTTNTVFGTMTATSATQSPFGITSNFGSTNPGSGSVFGSSTTTATTAAVANPFIAKTQQQNPSSPFGVAPSSQTTSPFGNFAAMPGTTNVFGVSVTVSINETAYSAEEGLTDDEKATYRMSHFLPGHIPLKPPTRELS